MKRVLIVNADDCNLTEGVTQAILKCHDDGIVSSTTFLINLPVSEKTLQALKRRKQLGVGLHLNVTLARPVSKSQKVKSLLMESGNFRKVREQLTKPPKAAELAYEYQNQIRLFQKVFHRNPTHLDTHHQVHDHPFFFRVLTDVARKNQLPIRRSQRVLSLGSAKVKTTDYFLGNLNPDGYWRQAALEMLLRNLPEGISEVMCHPGRNDAALRSISSFTTGREEEFRLFRLPAFKKMLHAGAIQLSHFGLCYT